MIFLKRACLCVLILFLAGCIPLASEAPDLASDADSRMSAQGSSEPTHRGGESVEDTTDPSDSFLVEIEFVESAPKDRFVIKNMGSCVLEELMIEFDLSQSAGMLIFDTTAAGAGVEVFQPFEVVEGDIVQLAVDGADDGVDDGDAALALNIANLEPVTRQVSRLM